jgi:transposase InsO family protein
MKKRFSEVREQLALTSATSEAWPIYFVMDALANGQRLKCLTTVDDFTKEAVGIVVDHGISGLYVARLLDRAARVRGYAKAVRTDQASRPLGHGTYAPTDATSSDLILTVLRYSRLISTKCTTFDGTYRLLG